MYWIAAILILPYFAFLADICRNLLRLKPSGTNTGSCTFISVIIACRNEQENLPALLGSLASQDYPREIFEIIIVDDNSADGTASVASSFSGSLPVRVITNKGSGKKQAIRTGVEAASGDFILTTDADCTMGKGWISSIASFFDTYGPEMIIGPVHVTGAPGFFGIFQELEFLSLQGITAGTAAGGYPVICNGANLAFTKAAYLTNLGNMRFEIATGDDVFLLHSMKKKKSRIMWIESDEARVNTKASPDLSSYLKQRKRWASKGTAYTDRHSIILGIVTFVTILFQAGSLLASVFNPEYMNVFLIIFILKSIPDFIIIQNTAKRYGRKNLMWWFVPCQIVYPFYVLIVAGLALAGSDYILTRQRRSY